MKVIQIIFLLISMSSIALSQDNFNTCNRKAIINDLAYFNKNVSEFINNKSDDNCVMLLMDTIVYLFQKTGNVNYIEALHSICFISDGYISEYFWELSDRLVFNSFGMYVDFLSSKKCKENCLEKYFFQIINTEKRKQSVLILIDKEFKQKNSKRKIKYLLQLQTKFKE